MESYKQTDDLHHYGVIGMKWGQRRASKSTPEQLKGRVEKLNKKNTKLANQVSKANLNASKHKVKSAKLERKFMQKTVRATSESDLKKARSLKFKANKETIKSEKITRKAMATKKRIAKNEAFISLYNKQLKSLNANTVENGKQYVDRLMSD